MPKITSASICQLLDSKHYDNTKSMVAFEVADATGGAGTRRADAISMEFWPSNGLEVIGYEIKVSRSDWLSELKQPEKSMAISQFCDRWYLVAPKGVLGIDELPKTWGYIQATEKTLRTKIKAPNRDARQVDKFFMASLLRKMIEKNSNTSLLDEKYNQLAKAAVENADRSFKYKEQRLNEKIESLEKVLEGFEEITGISLSRWSYKGTAQAIKFINSAVNRDKLIEEMKSSIRCRESLNKEALASIAALKEI